MEDYTLSKANHPDLTIDSYDLTGEQLKTIRQLVQKLKIKDGQTFNNRSNIHKLYLSWSKLSLLCEQIYTSAINYSHIRNQTNDQIQNAQSIDTPTIREDNNNYNNGCKKNISRYNGVKSLIKVVYKFVHHVENGLEDNGDQIHEITNMLIHLIELVNELFVSKQAIGTGKHATLYLLDTYLKSKSNINKGIASYWSHYPAFWTDENAQWIASIFSVISSSLSKLPFSLLSLVSRSAHGYWQEDLLHSANPYFPLNLANYITNPLTTGLSWVACKNSGLSITEISVPRQKEWHIPFDEEGGDGKVKFVSSESFTPAPAGERLESLKCRLVRQEGLNPNGNIIFHVQGGAFTIDLPSVFDECFRYWTPRLEGAVILDVYYSRTVRYPVCLQELLDVFLWLTNYRTNDVESQLGFIPKKIIFCGDSAGGLFLFSLATILRDIQLLSSSSSSPYSLGNEPFPAHLYPKSFVTFYPVLSITIPSVQPSLILSFLDQFLTPLTILNCLSLYSSGVIFDSECVNLESPDSNRYTQPNRWEAFYHTWIKKNKIWIECDKKTLDKRIDKIAGAALKPYKSPLVSYNLDLIKDLNVYLVCGEFDPFLDSNIEFSQLWPGKIKLDVIDDLGHGFLALTFTSKRSRNAAHVCLERLLEALKD